MGATAGGKTSLAVNLAFELNGEIISADSRQVYKGMDLGTGKDINEYRFKNVDIPYHLIDIVEAGYKYNVFEYQKDFLKAYNDILGRKKFPVMCGGTGIYIDAVLKAYKLINVPVNNELRNELNSKSNEDLIKYLISNRELHNSTDTKNRKRLIRAVEIALFYEQNPDFETYFPKINSFNIQIIFNRDQRRKRITERLKERLNNGMIEEVKELIDNGVSIETLKYYGLEYKFITEYLLKELTYKEMFDKLEIAIHQFSKRQMTWFRKMEKDGVKIHKIDGNLPLERKINNIFELLNKNTHK